MRLMKVWPGDDAGLVIRNAKLDGFILVGKALWPNGTWWLWFEREKKDVG